MKKQVRSLAVNCAGKVLFLCLILTLFVGKAEAANTYDWIGGNVAKPTDWATPGNWKVGSTVQTTKYPGSSSATDIADIGVNQNFTTANSPVLSTVLPNNIGSITFGVNNGVAMSLTISGVTLTTGAVTQQNSSGTTDITTTITDGASAGTLLCSSLTIGSTATPSSGTNTTNFNFNINTLKVNNGAGALALLGGDNFSGSKTNNVVANLNSGTLSVSDITTNDANQNSTCTFKMDIGTAANALVLSGTSALQNMSAGTSNIDFVSGGTLAQSMVTYGTTAAVVSTTADASSNGFSVSSPMYPNLTLSTGTKTIGSTTGGTLSVAGDLTTSGSTINLTSKDPAVTIGGDWDNSAPITMGAGTVTITGDLNNTSNTITGNTAAATLTVSGALVNGGTISVGSEAMTFALASTNSGTYTGGTGASKFTAGLTNTGTVTESTGTFTIGNFANNAGNFTGNSATATTSITGTLTNAATITVNYENIAVAGAATNAGTCAAGTGTGAITFGNSYTSSGTFTASAIFNAAGNQTITDNSASGTIFANAQFQGSGTKTLAGTKGFAVASSGTLTMAGTTTLATGGILTLNSDATGSAIVAVVPAACTISGNVNVQRFIEGTATTNRGYRLMSSPVYTASPSGVNVYDLSYLATTLWVSGLGYAGNGFNVTSTENPSIYLFREDIAPPPSTSTVFTTAYNWKGVAKINNSPLYNIGTQAKTTTANLNDFTTTIPVGNGILVFDRGSKTGGTAGKTVAPFIAPGNTTVTAIGQLNIGTINVIPWFTGSTSFSYTSAFNTAITTPLTSLSGGFALVGNPYAATIDWEKFNNTHTSPTNEISGTIGTLTIWEFNPTTKNYDTYIASNSALTGERATGAANHTGSGTNYIASGMGFFVKATAIGQTLTFTENAKVTTNGLSTLLNNLMGIPKQTAAQPVPYLRLKLITDSANNDDIVIGFDNKANTKFVNNEDAEDLGGNGSVESLSSFSADSIALAINMQPFPGKQPQVIRLLANATASGSYQLAAPEFGNMPKLYDVWLKDAFTADSVQLKLNTSYPFTIDKSNAATFGSSRFTVVIRQDSAYTYKLLDFTATKVDHQSDVQLVWKTMNEENYTRFTVERSTDNGKTFNVVGGMLGTGAGNYSLVDKNPDNGRNLYRLKQEDINDSVTYSKVVDVQFGNLFSKLHIFPNPATHTINLAIAGQGYYGGHYSIKFMNSAGRIVKEVESSQPEWQGNISYLMPGTYLVRVVNTKTQNLVGENKFVKL